MLLPGASLTSRSDLAMSIDLECAASVAEAVECLTLDAEHAPNDRAMSARERVLMIVTRFLLKRLGPDVMPAHGVTYLFGVSRIRSSPYTSHAKGGREDVPCAFTSQRFIGFPSHDLTAYSKVWSK